MAVIGAGPIGLMLVRLARLRGASVVAAGRNAGRLQAARALGADETVAVQPGEDLAAKLRAACGDGHGPDIVIEAVGLPETAEAAVRAVRKGGIVNLFAGCTSDARLVLDAQRLHYQELTIRSTFHHTPESIRTAYRLIAGGDVDATAFITSEATLDELPAVLARLSLGGDGLKTAILTWGRE